MMIERLEESQLWKPLLDMATIPSETIGDRVLVDPSGAIYPLSKEILAAIREAASSDRHVSHSGLVGIVSVRFDQCISEQLNRWSDTLPSKLVTDFFLEELDETLSQAQVAILLERGRCICPKLPTRRHGAKLVAAKSIRWTLDPDLEPKRLRALNALCENWPRSGAISQDWEKLADISNLDTNEDDWVFAVSDCPKRIVDLGTLCADRSIQFAFWCDARLSVFRTRSLEWFPVTPKSEFRTTRLRPIAEAMRCAHTREIANSILEAPPPAFAGVARSWLGGPVASGHCKTIASSSQADYRGSLLGGLSIARLATTPPNLMLGQEAIAEGLAVILNGQRPLSPALLVIARQRAGEDFQSIQLPKLSPRVELQFVDAALAARALGDVAAEKSVTRLATDLEQSGCLSLSLGARMILYQSTRNGPSDLDGLFAGIRGPIELVEYASQLPESAIRLTANGDVSHVVTAIRSLRRGDTERIAGLNLSPEHAIWSHQGSLGVLGDYQPSDVEADQARLQLLQAQAEQNQKVANTLLRFASTRPSSGGFDIVELATRSNAPLSQTVAAVVNLTLAGRAIEARNLYNALAEHTNSGLPADSIGELWYGSAEAFSGRRDCFLKSEEGRESVALPHPGSLLDSWLLSCTLEFAASEAIYRCALPIIRFQFQCILKLRSNVPRLSLSPEIREVIARSLDPLSQIQP